MHSVEFVKRQAAADVALQTVVTRMALAFGKEAAFDTSAARGDANIRRLLLMEQAVLAMESILEPEHDKEEAATKRKTEARADEHAVAANTPKSRLADTATGKPNPKIREE